MQSKPDMGLTCNSWQSPKTQIVARHVSFYSPRNLAFQWLQPPGGVQQFNKCNPRARADRTRTRPSVLTLAAAKPQSQREGPEKTNFFTKLIRPLRDFGLGKSSLWEGGVGLFIFAGIGMRRPSTAACCLTCEINTKMLLQALH